MRKNFFGAHDIRMTTRESEANETQVPVAHSFFMKFYCVGYGSSCFSSTTSAAELCVFLKFFWADLVYRSQAKSGGGTNTRKMRPKGSMIRPKAIQMSHWKMLRGAQDKARPPN